MLKINKKQVKLVSLVVAVFFLLGVGGVALSQYGKVAASPSANIGTADFKLLMSQHPDMAAAQTAMQAALDQANKDFEAKAATMSDQEKQDYHNQLQQQLNAKQQELFTPINDKVQAAVKAVAEAKGLTVVLDKGTAIYGGQDITAEAGKKIAGQ
ncbi:MAG: outer rane chaperone Skp (OmpH) [Firmicutes bacterium]|nr:outer rane chaperone Skp (OmpH) [Bacillota bacterium]